MLTHLRVSDFAIIDRIEIDFQEGLNILSGETGAGKSVLLRSLALLMGDKSDTDVVRTGCDHAVVEGSFDLGQRPDTVKMLEEMGLATDETVLIVRRLISRGGKSRVYLNGQLATVAQLRDLVMPLVEVAGHAPLIEMTGQHDNKNLMSRLFHLEVLDAYAGVSKDRENFASIYKKIRALEEEAQEMSRLGRERSQRLDFLRFQHDEIQSFDPQPGEEERLESAARRLRGISKLQGFADQLEQTLDSEDRGTVHALRSLLARGQELQRIDSALAPILETLSGAIETLREVTAETRAYGQGLQLDPEEMDRVDSRLSDLRKLQKKYGNTCSEICEEWARISHEIVTLETAESRGSELEQEIQSLRLAARQVGERLSRQRDKAAPRLAEAVNRELEDLNMKGVRFSVSLATQQEDWTCNGWNTVEFMIQSSAKDAPKPLSKFASGGELSRILLSLKQVVGENQMPRTYLFDEVDTGVSGPTAEKVGKKLHAISEGQQVICVTHLPQVAAQGDSHFRIEKVTSTDGVQMLVTRLNKSSRLEEIARLISGESVTATSLRHAKTLLQAASSPPGSP